MLDWERVKCVFLDMDGTLLDLHFDNHFWLEHLPAHIAQLRGISVDEAKQVLFVQFQQVEGTLAWYCLDHWSVQLGLDVAALKRDVAHLIAVRAHVFEFLQALRAAQKRVVLLTNAHGKSLAMKLQYTGIGEYFDRVLSAHEIGMAKEEAGFWARLQQFEPYEAPAALMVDDNVKVLQAAANYGVGQQLAMRYPDSTRGAVDTGGFVAIDDFRELLPIAPV